MAQLAFSIAALKQAFGEFSWERSAAEAFVLDQYCDFYQLRFQNFAQHFTGYVSLSGYQIAVQAWVPAAPRGTCFIVHGYFDHVGLYRHLIAWALAHELTVLAFDLPGHGLSSGEPVSIPDFFEYQHVLDGMIAVAEDGLSVGCAPKPWRAIGQSTGAGILLDYLLGASAQDALEKSKQADSEVVDDGAAENESEPESVGPPWEQIALLAPLVRVTSWGGVNVTYQLLHWFQDRVPRGFGVNSHDQAFLNFQKYEDPMQIRYVSAQWVGSMIRWARRIEGAKPCQFSPIILQGDEDTTVDYVFNLPVLSEKFAQPKIIMLPNGRHHLVNESEKIRAEMFGELDKVFFSTQL